MQYLTYQIVDGILRALNMAFAMFWEILWPLILEGLRVCFRAGVLLGYNFSGAVAVGYIDLFGIAVETGLVMVIYLQEALDARLARGPIDNAGIEEATIDGAVHRLRPKVMTVAVVVMSLAPILWETGISSDVMKPIAAPIVGGMITSAIHVLILVPVFFAMLAEHRLRRGTLTPFEPVPTERPPQW